MKATISVELDLKDCPNFNIKDIDSIKKGTKHLSDWLFGVHIASYARKFQTLKNLEISEEEKQEIINKCDTEIIIANQLLNNFKVHGITEDGHIFDYRHQEPRCQEKLVVDGKELDAYEEEELLSYSK